MKVWHVNHIAFVGPTLVAELNKKNWEAEAFDAPKPLAKSSLFIKVFGAPYRFIFARKMIRVARNNKVQIIHVHSLSTAIWYLFSGIPLVVHAHGADVRLGKWNLFRHLINFVVCKCATRILYATPDLQQYLNRYTDKAIFLPNPIDTELFSPTDVKAKSHLIMIHFALNYLKGTPVMLEAVRRLKTSCPALKFQAMEFGAYVEDARRLDIQLIPKARRQDLPKIISEAGLVIGQLHVGAVGMSELETLSLGKTVVCNFLYESVYDEAPPFVQVATVDEITNAIEAFYNDNQVYVELEEKARSWVKKYHRVDRITDQLIEIYKTILATDKQSLGPHYKPISQERSSSRHN